MDRRVEEIVEENQEFFLISPDAFLKKSEACNMDYRGET